jgi:hypothetical protein
MHGIYYGFILYYCKKNRIGHAKILSFFDHFSFFIIFCYVTTTNETRKITG